MMRTHVCALGVSAMVSLVACGGGKSSPPPANPIAPTPTRSSIGGTTVVTSTERTDRGVEYTTLTTLNESGGLAATIDGILVLLTVGGDPYAFVEDWDAPWEGTARITANGTLRTKFLTVIDAEPTAFADRVEVHVAYTDDRLNRGTVILSANSPALPAPSKHTLTGSVKSGTSGLRDVKIEIRTGANTGRTAKTDAKGQYRIADLTWDWFTVRASKSGYTAVEQSVLLSGDKAFNFTMKKGSAATGESMIGTLRSRAARRLVGEVRPGR